MAIGFGATISVCELLLFRFWWAGWRAGRCVGSAQRAGAAGYVLAGRGVGSRRACCCCSGSGGGVVGRMHFWTDEMPRSENFLSGAVGWFHVWFRISSGLCGGGTAWCLVGLAGSAVGV